MTTITLRAGTTAPLDLQLTQTDPVTHVTTPINLAGIGALELHWEDVAGNVTKVTLSSGLAVIDAANGKVRFTPQTANVLVAANRPYAAWFKLTDSTGAIVSIPSDQNFNLYVIPAF